MNAGAAITQFKIIKYIIKKINNISKKIKYTSVFRINNFLCYEQIKTKMQRLVLWKSIKPKCSGNNTLTNSVA